MPKRLLPSLPLAWRALPTIERQDEGGVAADRIGAAVEGEIASTRRVADGDVFRACSGADRDVAGGARVERERARTIGLERDAAVGGAVVDEGGGATQVQRGNKKMAYTI